MQVAQPPANLVQITGPRYAIEWAVERGVLPDARFHSAHGLAWLEVAQISQHAEAEVKRGGCHVHRK
jgi:hypothetical protein